MSSSAELVTTLREAWRTETVGAVDDYALVARVRQCYGAITRDGLPALVVPLAEVDSRAISKRAAGCELRAIRAARFRYGQEEWEGAAAAIVCNDIDVTEAFSVLAVDIATRLPELASWEQIAEIVAEWQALLASAARPSAELELGLWGELWLVYHSSDAATLVAGWRGPERDATDFFIDGVAAEVKASRYARQHHLSLSQVGAPTGMNPSFLLSLWVKQDPVRGVTVKDLVEGIELVVVDRAALLRGLLKAGYSRNSSHAYNTRYVLLAEPEWYPTSEVPTIREADPGVSNVRYQVLLDEERAVDAAKAEELWRHFLGHPFDHEEQ